MLPTSAYVEAESDDSDTDDSEEDRDEAEVDNYTEYERRRLTGLDKNIVEILGGADAVIDALAEATRDRCVFCCLAYHKTGGGHGRGGCSWGGAGIPDHLSCWSGRQMSKTRSFAEWLGCDVMP